MKISKNAKLVGLVVEIDGDKRIFDKFNMTGWGYESDEPGMSDSGIDLFVRVKDEDIRVDVSNCGG